MLQLDEWDWRRLLDVNLTGAFFCTQLLGRVMAEEGGGVILNVVFSTIPDPIRALTGLTIPAGAAVAMPPRLPRGPGCRA